MVQADLFSGSLAIWNALGFRIHFVRLIRLRRRKFKLSLEYSANWNFAKNLQERKLNLATRSTRFGAPVSSEFAAKRRGVLWSAAALRPRACPSETDRRRRGATLSNREVSIGGGGGIRTHGRREATRAFQARALGHYATPPFDASRIITFLGGRPIKSLSTFCSKSRTPKKFRIHNGERFCQVFAILGMLKA